MERTVVREKRKPSPRAQKSRAALLESKLSNGVTMRELYEAWGFRFDSQGWIVPGGASGVVEATEAVR